MGFLKKEVEDSIVLLEMAIDEQDNDVIKDIGNKIEQFRNRFGNWKHMNVIGCR